MTRYRPVPRTLSDILRRLARRPSNAPELMPPERLISQRAPMLDPGQLFQGVSVRPSHEAQTREAVASEGMKPPESLFGGQALALPGTPLASPQALDMLPGLPLPEVRLQPLPEPVQADPAAPDDRAEAPHLDLRIDDRIDAVQEGNHA